MQPAQDSEAHQAALSYFGRIAADIAHELRNRFATIKEKDGLLSDLLELAKRGRPADPERLSSLSADIKRHVDMAQETCNDLSQFSHLADLPAREENIDELVGLMARLTHRRGMQYGVEISSRTRAHVSAHVNPFMMGFVIFQCLDWAMKQEGASDLEISALRSSAGPGVEIRGMDFSAFLGEPPRMVQDALPSIPGTLGPGDGASSAVITIQEDPR